VTEHGVLDPGRPYESPFTDINSQGPDGIFTKQKIDDLLAIPQGVHTTAKAA
jgi:type I restriction enzyme R subunit